MTLLQMKHSPPPLLNWAFLAVGYEKQQDGGRGILQVDLAEVKVVAARVRRQQQR